MIRTPLDQLTHVLGLNDPDDTTAINDNDYCKLLSTIYQRTQFDDRYKCPAVRGPSDS